MATASNDTQFQYDNNLLDVIIFDNGEDDRDSYVELHAAAKLLAPLVSSTIRGFNHAVLWANVHSSQKLTRNNKMYLHVFALGRYLASFNFNSPIVERAEFSILKRLVCDLIVGAQSQVVDPLTDIKSQLCTLQECLNGNNASTQLYQTAPESGGVLNEHQWFDFIRDEFVTLSTNINNVLELIKSLQTDMTNKLAFSNDTMLDGFKSIKDIIIRKK